MADMLNLPNRNAAHGEEEGEEDAEEVSRWNMRKCSAAGLDVLSTVFQEELLPIVTPIVQQRLQEEDWRARESAILALGAIAEGCVMGLIPYLPQLVSMLLPRLEDPRPLVRSGLPPHVASCRDPLPPRVSLRPHDVCSVVSCCFQGLTTTVLACCNSLLPDVLAEENLFGEIDLYSIMLHPVALLSLAIQSSGFSQKDISPGVLARFGYGTVLDASNTVHLIHLCATIRTPRWGPTPEARDRCKNLTNKGGVTCCLPCRSISCWALSRYAQWIVERCSDPQQDANAAYIQLDEVLQVSITITTTLVLSILAYLPGCHLESMCSWWKHMLQFLCSKVSVWRFCLCLCVSASAGHQ